MNDSDKKQIASLLKSAAPPVGAVEPSTDLWPRMLARLGEGSLHVPWYDWAAAAFVLAGALFFRGELLVVLYHL